MPPPGQGEQAVTQWLGPFGKRNPPERSGGRTQGTCPQPPLPVVGSERLVFVERVEEISQCHGVHQRLAGTPAESGQHGMCGVTDEHQLAALVLVLANQQAGLSRVRLAVSLDRPGPVTAGHFRLVGGLEQALAALGVPDARARARDVADYGDGVLFHLLTVRRDEQPDPAAITAAIRRLLVP